MKPTLEEVKEYFKNAKEVKCLYLKESYLISNKTIFQSYTGFWISISETRNIKVYDFDNEKYAEIISYKDEPIGKAEQLQTPNHYDNSKGTLYKVATERNWNPYLFDIVKRLERAEKKGEFKTDLEKSINVIKLWLNESE